MYKYGWKDLLTSLIDILVEVERSVRSVCDNSQRRTVSFMPFAIREIEFNVVTNEEGL